MPARATTIKLILCIEMSEKCIRMRAHTVCLKQIRMSLTRLREERCSLLAYIDINILIDYFYCATECRENMCDICRDVWRIFKFLMAAREIHIGIDEAKPSFLTINKVEKKLYEIKMDFAGDSLRAWKHAIYDDFWIAGNVYVSDFFSSVIWTHFDDNICVNENVVDHVTDILIENEIFYDHPNQRVISTQIPREFKCPICLRSDGKTFAHLDGCPLHIFHRECLIKCLLISYRCPVCRRENLYFSSVRPANEIDF